MTSPAAPETPTPPTPSLAEAALRLLQSVSGEAECVLNGEWHMVGRFGYGSTVCPACSLRAALAAEEARRKRALETLRVARIVVAHAIERGIAPAGPLRGLNELIAALETSR